MLDVQSDADHNRSVLTLAGDDEARCAKGCSALFEVAVERIDLRSHQGEHPRLGAVDVVPFIPIEGATMADCVALARGVGQAVAERFGVPVFLYEEAATAPHRRNLEDIRRGEFEGLAEKMARPALAARLRAGRPAPLRRRDRGRRAHAAHRLQHQPGHVRRRDRQAHRQGASATAAAATASSRRWA